MDFFLDFCGRVFLLGVMLTGMMVVFFVIGDDKEDESDEPNESRT